ncbi:MAG: hypothetical protein AAGD47_00715 [Pseudomonadota bacterium]
MSTFYQGFGLRFRSDLRLSGLARAAQGPVDLRILVGTRARDAVEATGVAPMDLAGASPGCWCFRVPDLCDYLICRGEEIHLSPLPGAQDPHVALYLMGSALGMILHQRGLFALHAATVALGDTAIAFVGDQGAGKSTLAMEMALAGHRVLGDDVVVVSHGAGRLMAEPGVTQFKLWYESIDALDLTPGPGVANRIAKFYVDNPSMEPVGPHPLGAIVELARGPAESEITAARIGRFDALDLVARHTYRPAYIDLLDRRAAHFTQSAALVSDLAIWRLTRPEGLAHLAATRAWLVENWPILIGRAE